ncbi:MAG TPA: EAL domain-containing protein [Candidatus Limnocylindrales bacterium]
MHLLRSHAARLSVRTIVAVYVVTAVVWIALSDRLLDLAVSDHGSLTALSTLKGWAFVAVTGAMLAVMLHRYDAQRALQAAEIEARESRFRLIADHARDVISRYRVLPTPGFEYVSPSVEAVLGYPPQAFHDDPGLMERLIHPDDRYMLGPDPDARRLAGPLVVRLRHADGHLVWLEQSSSGVFDADGRLIAIDGVARDVTEREATQSTLARLNRVLRTLTAVNTSLVHAGSEAELLESICRIVVDEGTYRYAWIGYREDGEDGAIRPMTSAGYGPGHQLGQDDTWHPTERGPDPVGTSVREGRTVVLPDIAADPTDGRWRERALALGYVSGAAIPLLDGSRAFGTLVIYSTERDAFGSEELALLEQLAADLGYGVRTLRARAVHAAEEAERARLATAIEQTAESVVVTDPDANIVYVNPAFERVSGYPAAEVIGRNPRILQSGVHPPAVYAAMWATLAAGGTWTGELVNRRKDGTTYTEEVSIAPVVDAAGALASYVAVKRDVTHLREVETKLEGKTRTHAQIAATLARLQPGETPEVTGQAIADALLGLDGMDSPTVLIFDEAGRAVVLGRGGDRTGPVGVGGTLPERRSAYLLDRARAGAWTERWVPGPEDGDYGVRFVASGLVAAAYVPIPGEHGPIGILAVGTTDPSRADRLADQLLALGEFAPTARLLLERPLHERFDRSRSRTRIESIVADEAFHPVFQPIVDLGSRQPIGYEALTRFDDGTAPNLVFAEARRCGLERELESATLRAAVAESAALPVDRFVSLNVSPGFITAGDELREILAARTRAIVVEVTEHDHVEDYGALRSAFVALGSGLRLAVDDAGAGVANFTHLVELRPQLVKVDIGLVRGVNADLTRQALIVALLHFAGATDCQVVAEGIETEAERAVLQELEVPLGQGYLFGRPAEASAWAVAPVTGSALRRARGLWSIAGGSEPRR